MATFNAKWHVGQRTPQLKLSLDVIIIAVKWGKVQPSSNEPTLTCPWLLPPARYQLDVTRLKSLEDVDHLAKGSSSSSCNLKVGTNLEKVLEVVQCLQPKFTNNFSMIKLISVVRKTFSKNLSDLNYSIGWGADNTMH